MYLSRTSLEVLWAARRLFSHRCEFLAAWTKMCTALSDDNAFDRRATAHTRFSLLVVHTDMVIIIAGLPPQIAIFVERCSPMLYAERQYRDDALVQTLYLVRCERICAAQGSHCCMEKSLLWDSVTLA